MNAIEMTSAFKMMKNVLNAMQTFRQGLAKLGGNIMNAYDVSDTLAFAGTELFGLPDFMDNYRFGSFMSQMSTNLGFAAVGGGGRRRGHGGGSGSSGGNHSGGSGGHGNGGSNHGKKGGNDGGGGKPPKDNGDGGHHSDNDGNNHNNDKNNGKKEKDNGKGKENNSNNGKDKNESNAGKDKADTDTPPPKKNDSSEGKGDYGDDFVGTLKGEKVHLKDVKTKEIIYTKRSPEDTAKLRKEFDSTVRKKFLEKFANDPNKVEQLRKAGLTDVDIARMKDGLVPKGWQVHHKLPLDDGGTNALDNLVLIKNDPYHKAITNAQNDLTRGLEPGQNKTINWPIPDGDIYPPLKEW